MTASKLLLNKLNRSNCRLDRVENNTKDEKPKRLRVILKFSAMYGRRLGRYCVSE